MATDAVKFEDLPMRQRNFVANYLANGFNATQAAKDAGFSPKTADSQASRLLKNAKVAAVIAERVGKALKRREISVDRTLDELAKVAYFDPVNDPEGAACLPEVKSADKVGALDKLMRYHGLYRDKVEHTHKIERVLVREAVKQKRTLPPSKPEF